jgi:chaperonin GroEL
MHKRILTREQLLAPKMAGLSQIAGIVKRTLGPGGLLIMIQRQGQALDGSPLGPKITKDGVSVADECSSPNPQEDIVIQAVKAICKKTNTTAGDGTTTAIVLGEAIVVEMEKVLAHNTTLNPQLVKESVDAAAQEILAKLKKIAVPVKDMSKIREVATISANGDEEIGNIIGDAFDHVGAEGVVTVDEGSTGSVTLEKVDGYQFNRGAEARNSFFNNKEQTQFEAEQCRVVIYDGKLQNYMDILPALRAIAELNEQGQPKHEQMPATLIIANDFSNEVLQFLMIQKQDSGMKLCAVQGPNTTHVRSGYYDDLAVYTGGTRLGNGNRNIQSITLDDVGIVDRVIVDKYKTTLYEGQGAEDDLLTRVDQLKAAKKVAESPYDAQILNDRIGSLTNGIAKINVGGQTELEIKEKYDRIEDALNAARAAIEEGIVPGGGTTLLRLADKIDPNKSIGHEILAAALGAPFFQILNNIGYSMTPDELNFILKGKNRVFDARHKKVKNALTAGIIDPVKVTRSALQNAVSIATLLSTAGGAIIYENEK